MLPTTHIDLSLFSDDFNSSDDMPGSLCEQCQTQKTVFSKTCNSCFINSPKDKMLQELKKYEWGDHDDLHYDNNSSKMLTSTKVLLYKLQSLGFVPLLLLGKRRGGSKHIDMDSFCPHPKVIEETGSIETLRNIYLGLLNVTLCTESQFSPESPEPDGKPATVEVERTTARIDPVGITAPAELQGIPISIRLNIIPTATDTGQANTTSSPVGCSTTINQLGTTGSSKQDGIPISIRLNIIPTPSEPRHPSATSNPGGISNNPVGSLTGIVPAVTPPPIKLDEMHSKIPSPVAPGKLSTPNSQVKNRKTIDSIGNLATTMVDSVPTLVGLNELPLPIEPSKPSTSTNPMATPPSTDPLGNPASAELHTLPTSTDANKAFTETNLDKIPTYICVKGVPTSICLNGIPTPIHPKSSRPIQPKIPRQIQPKVHQPIPPGKTSPPTHLVDSPIPIDEECEYSESWNQDLQRPKRKSLNDGDLSEVEDGDTSTQNHKKIKITEDTVTMDTDTEKPMMSRHAEVDTEVLDELEKNDEEWQNIDMNSETDSPSVSRHAEVDAEELKQLEKSSIVHATNKQTLWAINCFKDWLAEKRVLVDFSTIEKHEMNGLLRDFYCSVRRGKGGEYCIPSYIGLRAGLNRFINLRPFSRAWCLMKDSEFSSSNKVFIGVLKKIRREGRETTSHPKVIKSQDLDILINSVALSPYTPKGLANKVWFDIQLHFGRRGKEGNRQLTPQSFVITRNENGIKYAKMISKEDGKLHKDTDRQNRCGIMFENPGSHLCPVASLEKYLSKIPKDATSFFLHPKKMVITSDSIWYSQEPMGFNYLGSMLPRMCQEAGTSEKYTNHCFGPLREIMSVSSHKAESSIKKVVENL
ncbi:hypothetical protein UPYG_G00069070 [Umbra pygmaea]|uniref:ZMYM2-like/QRICH1 C-terminal domain-containing protein n=1 Tax=Umbra pygmaea TaxID=75934 RepID=A0ABD0XB52_UMBPY